MACVLAESECIARDKAELLKKECVRPRFARVILPLEEMPHVRLGRDETKAKLRPDPSDIAVGEEETGTVLKAFPMIVFSPHNERSLCTCEWRARMFDKSLTLWARPGRRAAIGAPDCGCEKCSRRRFDTWRCI